MRLKKFYSKKSHHHNCEDDLRLQLVLFDQFGQFVQLAHHPHSVVRIQIVVLSQCGFTGIIF